VPQRTLFEHAMNTQRTHNVHNSQEIHCSCVLGVRTPLKMISASGKFGAPN